MPPKKGAKRKSESPTTEGNLVERKEYRTRSSNRKRVSYNESDSNEEPPTKIVCSSSDDDFVIDGDATGANNEQISKTSPFTASQNKKNSKSSAPKKNTLKSHNVTSSSQIPINSAFKPVSLDSSKIKSELNLSDSDSESSSSDCNSKSSQNETRFALPGNTNKVEECKVRNNTPQKKEILEKEEPVYVENPWMKNLEALQNDYVIEEKPMEAKNNTKEPSTKKKGKQLKQAKKKSNKITERSESNEISVAEMLELENAQNDSCSEDDENWERVKPATINEQERELPQSVEVTLDITGLKRKKKGMDVENLIRLKINRIRREIQLVITFLVLKYFNFLHFTFLFSRTCIKYH